MEAMAATVSDVDKETIINLVDVAKAECAEHDSLRRNWAVRLAQEADQQWRQQYLRLRKLSCSRCCNNGGHRLQKRGLLIGNS